MLSRHYILSKKDQHRLINFYIEMFLWHPTLSLLQLATIFLTTYNTPSLPPLSFHYLGWGLIEAGFVLVILRSFLNAGIYPYLILGVSDNL